MEWCDLPPGHAIPQAFLDPARVVRRSGVGRSRGGAGAALPRHKTATLRRKPLGMGRYAGDRLNHPRYRDFAMIPEADFFQ